MKSLATALSAVFLAGCAASPTLDWKRPAVDESKSRLATSVAQAVSLRSVLETKVSEQAGAQVNLNNALLGLGVLTTGLALGKVNADAYTGTAFLAGSAYLFGTQNISKPRLSVYQTGISAVNCALRAVAPINIGPAGEKAVLDGSQQLIGPVDRLQKAIAAVDKNQVGLGLSADRQAVVDTSLIASKLVLMAAVKTASDAANLQARIDQAGADLSGTVDKIAEQVDKLAIDTIPASSTIVQMLGGLASISAGFAPGLTLNQLPAPKKAVIPGPTAEGLVATPVLDKSLVEMESATSAVEVIQSPLSSRLAGYGGNKAVGSLADCGVSEIVIALNVDVDSLSFKGKTDETHFIAVSGGVKPYVARLRESPSGGVDVKSPLPGDSNVEVFVPKSVEGGTLHVVVMDGSNPRRSKEVKVIIGAGSTPVTNESAEGTGAAKDKGKKSLPANSPQGPKVPNPQPAESLKDRLAKAVVSLKMMVDKADSGSFSVGAAPQNLYRVTTVESPSEQSVVVSLTCTFGGRPTGDLPQGVRVEMLKKARALKLVAQSPSLDVLNKLELKVSEPRCLKAPT